LNDLLAYSQAGASDEQSPEIVRTEEVVGKALENMRAAIEETGAEIVCEPLPEVLGHETQLVQLFQNLISNAIKYRGRERPQVRISARSSGQRFVFSVRDNGIGIPPEYQQAIFGVFKRLHGKEIPGTGIGLAICSKVVEQHGGRIWVLSEPGQGAEFLFTLPPANGGAAVPPESA
jgi:signal transduction histidine kinase